MQFSTNTVAKCKQVIRLWKVLESMYVQANMDSNTKDPLPLPDQYNL